MLEAAVKKQYRTPIEFPSSPDQPKNITLNSDQLQDIIAAAINESKKKPTARKRTNSLYRSDGVKKATPADPIRTKEDFQKMVETLGNSGPENLRLRNQTLFVLGCSVGLRCGDLLRLKTADVYTTKGDIRKHVELIEEKTKKRNSCKIPDLARTFLLRYLDEKDFDINNETFLFQNKKGGPLSLKRVYFILNEAGKKCGFEGKISTHSMRKTYAMAALQSAEKYGDAGQTLEMLQMKLNHSDARITMRYCKAAQDKMDEMSDRVSDWFE